MDIIVNLFIFLFSLLLLLLLNIIIKTNDDSNFTILYTSKYKN